MKLISTTVALALFGLTGAIQIYSQQNYGTSPAVYQTPQYTQQVAYQPRGFSKQQDGYTQAAYQGQQVQSPEGGARILSHNAENNGHSYHYSFETDNGIQTEESGQINKGTQARGAYSYRGNDGQVYSVRYTADENGFRPEGAHLPTPPPIPDAILKSVEQNAYNEVNGIYDDGSYKPNYQQAVQQNNYQQTTYQQASYQPQVQQQNHLQQGYQQNGYQQNAYLQNNYQQSVAQNIYQPSTNHQIGYQQSGWNNGVQQIQANYKQNAYQQNIPTTINIPASNGYHK
ncbi:cuticle protein 3-like [Achroia grisella]|uniref:cuticle protein 3-like n=1 Tax=Achroia grisella TaxID=688607 RepID=UPI0027D29430|nr:cuticle protein 3-like [Achroia grisella]